MQPVGRNLSAYCPIGPATPPRFHLKVERAFEKFSLSVYLSFERLYLPGTMASAAGVDISSAMDGVFWGTLCVEFVSWPLTHVLLDRCDVIDGSRWYNHCTRMDLYEYL